jgi:hypothetical protein
VSKTFASCSSSFYEDLEFSSRHFGVTLGIFLKEECVAPLKSFIFSKNANIALKYWYVIGNSSAAYGLTWLWVSQYLRDGLLYGEVRPVL